MNITVLDCTLRDGCYICNSNFGADTIRGIIQKLEQAGTEIIEIGWLKDKAHTPGTAFYHLPEDAKQYMGKKDPHFSYVVMIDWDRYNLDNLPVNDGTAIDAIRVVFPHGKHHEGIEVGKAVKAKGYDLYLQAANTLAYSNEDLIDLCACINEAKPIAISIVDTFGAMYPEDLKRIAEVMDAHLDPEIKIGFHSHNNQQLSFALSIQFAEMFQNSKRDIMIDASLTGMGRGAGNTTTELLISYLNRKQGKNYDMNAILAAIDQYMVPLQKQYEWGYSIPYFISGTHCAHVNNLAYLLEKHQASNEDIWDTFENEKPEDRLKYDYDVLEACYQSRKK
ncbi:MAG: aldolase catalytic domain-containing protein [Bacilli bacterium]|nr:aldolase catalytic domain-containing protein [Bacilli bacterium]